VDSRPPQFHCLTGSAALAGFQDRSDSGRCRWSRAARADHPHRSAAHDPRAKRRDRKRRPADRAGTGWWRHGVRLPACEGQI